jgi:adenine-specific DNA-methyltransferase
MFFTVSNATRIDFFRQKLDEFKDTIDENEYKFLLASLLVSADAVSNVPAVYGCYLKNFKAKAQKEIVLVPIHTNEVACNESRVFHGDVLQQEFPTFDMVYLDPPYNSRQYSKNYFPLNIIAKTEEELSESELKGKTGIPTDCFLSSFCKKDAATSFDRLFATLQTKWIFLSYNSESIVSKEKMETIMKKYGTVSVVEKEYKRFKSFEYNEDKNIKEYLFCMKKL